MIRYSIGHARGIAAGMLLLSMAAASAEEGAAATDEAAKWGGEVEFGYAKTSGNTDIENIVLKAKLENDRRHWFHEVRFSGMRTKDSGNTTAKNYVLQGLSRYKWSQRQYVFASGRYEKDDFAGYDYRIVGVVGVGRQVLKAESYHLDLEAGAGGRQTAFIDKPDSSEAIGRLAGDFKWQISETSEFSEELYSELGNDNTATNSLSELKVKVIGHLAVKMAVRVTHNTDVPPDTDKTDVRSAVTVVYDF
ncbi:MAG: YdiY family protein [Gammaproteobacteria bacterium]